MDEQHRLSAKFCEILRICSERTSPVESTRICDDWTSSGHWPHLAAPSPSLHGHAKQMPLTPRSEVENSRWFRSDSVHLPIFLKMSTGWAMSLIADLSDTPWVMTGFAMVMSCDVTSKTIIQAESHFLDILQVCRALRVFRLWNPGHITVTPSMASKGAMDRAVSEATAQQAQHPLETFRVSPRLQQQRGWPGQRHQRHGSLHIKMKIETSVSENPSNPFPNIKIRIICI